MNLLQAGEHPIKLQGIEGLIEAVICMPQQPKLNQFTIMCHPHSLQGGTMNNKVVTTVCRAMRDLQIPSLRFNFRGVGTSEGTYNAGLGEADDLLMIINWAKQQFKFKQLILGGFSFGSYVAYRASDVQPPNHLILVAPPVNHFDFKELPIPKTEIHVIQGLQDEIVPADEVFQWIDEQIPHEMQLFRIDQAGHFFHGKLVLLKSILEKIILGSSLQA